VSRIPDKFASRAKFLLILIDCLWIFMDFHVFPKIFMQIHENAWKSMKNHGNLYKFIEISQKSI